MYILHIVALLVWQDSGYGAVQYNLKIKVMNMEAEQWFEDIFRIWTKRLQGIIIIKGTLSNYNKILWTVMNIQLRWMCGRVFGRKYPKTQWFEFYVCLNDRISFESPKLSVIRQQAKPSRRFRLGSSCQGMREYAKIRRC